VIDEARLLRLLGRGFLLSQVVEHWQARAIWVVSRADAEYPRRLKVRLREDAPAVIYGCGDMRLLDSGCFAVVGSRHADDSLIDYTIAIGKLTARAGRTLVSGGAKGIDQAAMRGALEAGGKVSGVLADSLEKTSMNREHRNLLLNDQLVLISPYDPSAGFNVGNAMQRNKLIYALADASLVVSSDLNKGGTWAGAIEQLDKFRFAPIYVRSTGESSLGIDALRAKGAMPWPNPQDTGTFECVFDVATPSPTEPAQTNIALHLGNAPSNRTPEQVTTPLQIEAPVDKPETTWMIQKNVATRSDKLFDTVLEISQVLLKTPMKDVEFATALGVCNAQAKTWLKRLMDQGVIEKQKKPAGYVVKQPGMFA
jgi:predicted Rossmann fold nucleotide-binding protein DprA/Smf involved in DNA uptake